MSDDPFDVCYLTDGIPSGFTDQVCDRASNHGFSTADATADQITLEYDDIASVTIHLNRGETWDWNEPRVLVSFWTMPLQTDVNINPDQHTRSKVQQRVDAIVGLLLDIVELIDPVYAWSMLSIGTRPDRGLRPMERPIVDDISRMSWLTVFSEELVEDLGGLDHVLETPAWRVETLESGHIVVIATDNPTDPSFELASDPGDHLLDGENQPDESRDNLDLADPFAALDMGEYGADVCLHRDDIARSFPNEDLRLIRVEVDEERNLRRVDTGAFVRNVVDADPGDDADLVGRMLSDIPADATDADLHVSALFHAAVPPAFVRLDGPDDENLVTKVMALDLNVSKVELLVTFGRVAQHDDFTQENLDSMEGAMDTLAQVDADAATQYVRENFL